MDRGKQAVAVDLKQPDGVETLLRLMESADVFFEVFRPGVAERLGIGPDAALARNPRLVYGRLTGWGQDGPYAQAAGHDIDYIALGGRARAAGPRRGEADTADQRARRLRRRRNAARVRDRVRGVRSRPHR